VDAIRTGDSTVSSDQIPEHLKDFLNTPELQALYLDTSKVTVLGPEQLIAIAAETKTPKELTKIVYNVIDEIEQSLGIDSYHCDLGVDDAIKGIKEAVKLAKEGSMEPEEVLDLDGKLRDLDFYLRALEAAKKKLREGANEQSIS